MDDSATLPVCEIPFAVPPAMRFPAPVMAPENVPVKPGAPCSVMSRPDAVRMVLDRVAAAAERMEADAASVMAPRFVVRVAARTTAPLLTPVMPVPLMDVAKLVTLTDAPIDRAAPLSTVRARPAVFAPRPFEFVTESVPALTVMLPLVEPRPEFPVAKTTVPRLFALRMMLPVAPVMAPTLSVFPAVA